MSLVLVNNDIIECIINYCDEFSIYFLMQTCKRFAKIINYYDINILGIRQYSIATKNRGIYKWFLDARMTIDNKYILDACIKLAIKANDISLVRELMPYESDNMIYHVKTAIKYHRNEILSILLTIPDMQVAGHLVSVAISNNNAFALDSIFEILKMKCKQLVTPRLIKIAANNLSFDVLEMLKRRVGIICICHLTSENLKIMRWCMARDDLIDHPDISILFDAIERRDSNKLRKRVNSLIRRFGIEIKSTLDDVAVRCIENNDLDRLKFMVTFKVYHDPIVRAAMKCDNLEILKYLNDRFTLSMNALISSAIRRDNMDIVKWAHENGGVPASNVRLIAISHGRLDIFEWLNSIHIGIHTDDDHVAHIASITNNMSALKYLIQHGYTMNHHVINTAITNNNWHIFKWAANNGCPRNRDIDTLYTKITLKFGLQFCI